MVEEVTKRINGIVQKVQKAEETVEQTVKVAEKAKTIADESHKELLIGAVVVIVLVAIALYYALASRA